jgi:hypothetical protein
VTPSDAEIMLFARPTKIALHSDFSPDECARRLSEAIDPERRALVSLSGYKGSKPFLGTVEGWQFRILLRTYNRNGFPPVLSGSLQPERQGARVKGVLDLEITSKIAICLLSAFGLLVVMTLVIFVYPLTRHTGRQWIAILVGCGFLILALGAPRFVRGMGTEQEKNLADFLRTTLLASDAPPDPDSGCDPRITIG